MRSRDVGGERDQPDRAQRHGWQSSRRAVSLWGSLAIGLAILTSQHARHFESERALWTQAVTVAPDAPRPWIGLAWVALDAGELATASADLDQAWARTDRLSEMERNWARDSIDATRALIAMRRGQLVEAGRLMAQGPPLSERAALCEHFARICALGTP